MNQLAQETGAMTDSTNYRGQPSTIGGEAQCEEGGEDEVPLDHALPSRLVASPAVLQAFALLCEGKQGELADLGEVGGQLFLV